MVVARVRPIYGGGGGPVCSVLELESSGGAVRILLDCGWNSTFDVERLKTLQEELPSISLVLLSSADLMHMGALPFCVANGLSPRAGIYATFPTVKLGQMALYDAFLTKADEGGVAGQFTLDDVDTAVERIKALKYDERLQVRFDRIHDTLISPRVGGRLLGGAIWHIRYGVEEIVYASAYGWNRSLMVAGASSSLGRIRRPALFITDAQPSQQFVDGASAPPPKKAEALEQETHRLVLETLRRSGNILVPCDAAGRALELLFSLNKLWASHRLHGNYKLVFLSHTSHSTVEFARCLMEWVSRDLAEVFEMETRNPYSLKHVLLCHGLDEVEALMGRFPVCAVTTDRDMKHGFSKALLEKWASDPFSLVLATQRSDVGVDARTPSPLTQIYSGKKELRIHVPVRVKRNDAELEELRRTSDRKKREQQEAERLDSRVRELEQEMAMLDDEDSDNEGEAAAASAAEAGDGAPEASQGGGSRGVKRSRMLLFDRFAKKRHPMFEDVEGLANRGRPSAYGLELTEDDLSIFRNYEAQRQRGFGSASGGGSSYVDTQTRYGPPSLSRADSMQSTVSEAQDAAAAEKEAEEKVEEDMLYKVVLEQRTLEVNCRVSPFLDWSGLTARDSREAFLRQMKPKQLLLLNTEKKQALRLKRALRRGRNAADFVRVPEDAEDVEYLLDTSNRDVAVDNDVAGELEYQRIPGSATLVASLSGALRAEPEGLKLGTGATADAMGQLTVQPARDSFLLSARRVDVAALKRALDEAGMRSVLRFSKDRKTSMLVVDDSIVVRVANDAAAVSPALDLQRLALNPKR
mmetsp:Transcript_14715/g.44226  ORF Transcript_14715/g.44226 Transcript_14715/m.44226 type:complete len:809 (-) Transcript_14715:155-2581(-)